MIGLIFLAAALLLLFAGQTFLRDHLRGIGFAIYWLLCLGFVALAMLVALIDLLVIRHQARRQQFHLIQNTLGTAHPPTSPPENRTSPDSH
jgi:O-antigen ligase